MSGSSAARKCDAVATNLAAFCRLLDASHGVRGVQKIQKDVPGDASRGAETLCFRIKEHDA